MAERSYAMSRPRYSRYSILIGRTSMSERVQLDSTRGEVSWDEYSEIDQDASDALRDMFRWTDSPQGEAYWTQIYDRLLREEKDRRWSGAGSKNGKIVDTVLWKRR